VGLIDDVAQNSAPDSVPLVRRLDLYLAYFNAAGLLEQLNHPHALPVDFDNRDMPGIPALRGVTNVTSLVPTSEGGNEEISVDASA
jgi:hypothetical protein